MSAYPLVWRVSRNGSESFVLATAHIPGLEDAFEAAKPYIDSSRLAFFEAVNGFRFDEAHYLLPDGKTVDDFLPLDVMDELREVVSEQLLISFEPDEANLRLGELLHYKLWHLTNVVVSLNLDENDREYQAAVKRAKQIASRFQSPILTSPEEYSSLQLEASGLLRVIHAYERKKKETLPKLDNAICSYAMETDTPVRSLDTPDQYTAIKDSLSLKTQIAFLVEIVSAVKEGRRLYTSEDVRVFQEGDLDTLTTGLQVETDWEREYQQVNCHGRTNAWYADLVPEFKQGGISVLAGAGHVALETGLLSKLEHDGYLVERV